MTRKSTLSPESAAIVSHLKQHGAATLDTLLGHFPAEGRSKLLKRLGNLVALGWIDFSWDDAGDKTWFIRASARAIAIHTAAPAAPCQAEPAQPIAGPRRVNVMAGVYMPPAGPALRPGALDFQRVGSVGFRC